MSSTNPRLPFVQQTVLIQVALQTTGENELQGGVADVVSHINSRFSTLTYQPVVFLHTQDLTFNQYLALLTVADTFMVSSLREGMALRSHEYVECQEGRKRPLILSEVGPSHFSRLPVGISYYFGNSSREPTRTADSARASLSTLGIKGIRPLPFIRSFLSYFLRESETNPPFAVGFDHVR